MTLFERHKKRLVPTPEAMILFEEVEKSFVGIEKLSRTAEELQSFHRGTLRIVSMPALAQGFMPRVVHDFMRDHKGVAVTLQVRSSQQVADWISTQHFDIGITAVSVSDPAIEVQTLSHGRLVCILPPGHRLQHQDCIRPEHLEGEMFVSLGTEQSVRYKVDEVFDKARVSRQLTFDTQVSHVACSFVLAGTGVALVDPMTALQFRPLGLLVKRFEPDISFTYNIIYPATRAKSRLTLEFTERLKNELQRAADDSDGLFEIRLPGQQGLAL